MLAGLFLGLSLRSADLLDTRSFLSGSGETVAVRASRVILRPGKELADATILIERGVIVAIGKDVSIPPGTRVIEGAVACAGFVDPWSSLGLDPGSVYDP